ncbi:MAG: DUF4381 domain-containing protein [Pseudomonadales bacterium]
MAQANPGANPGQNPGVNQGGMPSTQGDPLSQLRDIHLPPPIETWPLAPGWWVLALLAIVLLMAISYWLWRRWRANGYRREARKELGALLNQYALDGDTSDYLQACQQLLKRVALTHYSREHVANLTGESWVAFLDRSLNSNDFSMGSGQILIDVIYSPPPTEAIPAADVQQLHQLADLWIRKHRKIVSAQQSGEVFGEEVP